jgi:hypothetical protein
MPFLMAIRGAAAILAGCVLGSLAAQEYRYATNLTLELPDGGGLGAFVQHQVSGVQGAIARVALSLDLSGTWSGDLYAYLNFGDAHAVLLNRVGRTALHLEGYGDHGFQVRFDDQAPNGDIHQYRVTYEGVLPLSSTGALTGLWAPDGRTSDPDAVLDTDPRTATLSAFNGMDPNGWWTLFLADVAPGSVHVLRGWELTIRTGTDVPPPRMAARLVAAGIEIRVLSEAGVTYLLDATDRLPALSWEQVASLAGTGGEIVFGPFPAVRPVGAFRVRAYSGPIGPQAPRLNARLVTGGIEVRLASQSGVTYRLEATETLPASSWQTVATLPGDGSEIVFGPFPTTLPTRAFRVSVE